MLAGILFTLSLFFAAGGIGLVTSASAAFEFWLARALFVAAGVSLLASFASWRNSYKDRAIHSDALIAIAAILAAFGTFLSIFGGLYWVSVRERGAERDIASAELVFRKFEVGNPIVGGKGPILNYYFFNIGKTPANSPRQDWSYQVFDHEPTLEEVESLWKKTKKSSDSAKVPTPMENVIRQNDGRFNTIWNLNLTVDNYELIMKGKAWFTLLMILKYIDENTKGSEYRVTEFCGSFVGTFAYWKECGGHNMTYTVRP